MDKKITVIGSGAMATAISKALYDAGNKNILIYGVDILELEDLKKGFNKKYFGEKIKLPLFRTTNNLQDAINEASYVVLAVPSIAMKKVFKNILNILKKEILVISVSKGFYPDSSMSLHEGLIFESKNNKFIRGVVSVTGPSHAEEIVEEQLTTICAVDFSIENAKEVQKMLSNNYLKLYVQTDVVGAEVGSTFKNILAIFAGIANELGYGINTLAAILTRGLNEMKIYNEKKGGKISTILGLTGVGDLIVTATSDLSRNFSFGKEFVRNREKALKTTKTVEGIKALKHIYEENKKIKLDLPIINSLYELIFENHPIEDLKQKIWNRSLKTEFE